MMNDPMNKIIMTEIGLTVDDQSRVMDQDTREYLRFNSKNLKYSSQNQVTLGNKDMQFDPVSNRAVMGNLFDYYANKLSEEGEAYVSMYSERIHDDKTSLEVKVDDKVITTKPYYNDSLKFVDAIQQLNGATDVDLSEYDKKKEQDNNPKPKRRNNKHKSIFR